MTALDVNAIRRDFPILQRTINGHPLAFLDSAASSQRPRQVVEAMTRYYYQNHANVHRGAYTLAGEATEAYEGARVKVAKFLGAPEPRSLIFTRNTTEAINLLAASWGRSQLQPGDEIVLSVAEHHANLVPWQVIAQERGAIIKVVRLTPEQRLDMASFEAALTERTRLVTTFHMSNVLGSINPIKRIAELTHAAGALLLVDGAQGAPHMPVDVTELGCDFYAVSGHKMLAPTGIGALWGRPELLEELPPFLLGGEMIDTVTLEGSTFAGIPQRFEAGTPSIAEAVGFGAAVDYLSDVGMELVAQHDHALVNYALEQLTELGGVTLYGPRGDDRGGIVSFNVDGVHAHDVATMLDFEGVAVRAGKHCAHPLGVELGVVASARASFYLYNTFEEIDRLVAAVANVRDRFGVVA